MSQTAFRLQSARQCTNRNRRTSYSSPPPQEQMRDSLVHHGLAENTPPHRILFRRPLRDHLFNKAGASSWPGRAARGRYRRPPAHRDPMLPVTNGGFIASRAPRISRPCQPEPIWHLDTWGLALISEPIRQGHGVPLRADVSDCFQAARSVHGDRRNGCIHPRAAANQRNQLARSVSRKLLQAWCELSA